MVTHLPVSCVRKCERAAAAALPEVKEQFASDPRCVDHPWLLTLHASGTYQIVQADALIPVHQPAIGVPIAPTDSPEALASALQQEWLRNRDLMADW